MKLQLQKIRFKNFFSFGNAWTVIQLDAAPTTLIMGKNGSGKSSGLLDTISFALFNKPFRNITKPQLTNTINNKHCLVELTFLANGYQILVRRGLKPAVFEIFKDGELVNQTADNRDYQDAFERHILKVNHKTFCQIVMLGSAIFTPFMALPTPQRRAVIEDLLDLQIFSTMNTLLKEKVQVTDTTINDIVHHKHLLEERQRLTQEHIASTQESRQEMISAKEVAIQDQEQSILDCKTELAEHDEKMQKLLLSIQHKKLVGERLAKITKVKHQLQHRHTQIQDEIGFLRTTKTCPTCAQEIDPEFRDKTIEEKESLINQVNNGIMLTVAKHVLIEDRLTTINAKSAEIAEHSAQMRVLQARIDAARNNICLLQNEIIILNKKIKSVDISKLDEVQKELSTCNDELCTANDERITLGYAIHILKDSGIKSKIIKTFIPVINQLINKYLAALDFFVEFNLDESFEEKLLSRFRDEFSYESFSEGEKMRLNIAVLFAWRALAKLRGSIDCNLIILDELLDSSLDEDGLDDVLKLLTNLTVGENVYVISHKGDRLVDRFDRTLVFEKTANFSKVNQHV